MEVRELLQEYGYNSEETPIITGSALYALEVSYILRFLAYYTNFAYLWSPYGIGRPYIFSCCGSFFFMVALCNRADHYIFILFLLSFFFFLFFSSPNPSSRRLDVYHTSAHGVVLV